MLHDISATPAQLMELGEWVTAGPMMADVELRVDDRVLIAEQGDDRTGWNADGSPAEPDVIDAPAAPKLFLSADERAKARELLADDARTWRRVADWRHTTDAERELFERNASILERIAARI